MLGAVIHTISRVIGTTTDAVLSRLELQTEQTEQTEQTANNSVTKRDFDSYFSPVEVDTPAQQSSDPHGQPARAKGSQANQRNQMKRSLEEERITDHTDRQERPPEFDDYEDSIRTGPSDDDLQALCRLVCDDYTEPGKVTFRPPCKVVDTDDTEYIIADRSALVTVKENT